MELDLPIITKLAGVTFGDCQKNIRLYAHPYAKFRFEREPLNEFDPNAISIKANGYHVGYIPRWLAKMLVGVLDNFPEEISIKFVRRNISKKDPDLRGLTIKIIRNGEEFIS